jgi:hypothetical protein
MTLLANMCVRLTLALLVAALCSCSGGLPKGATSVYLTIQNGAGQAIPDQLLVTAYGDGTPVYSDERLPRSGALTVTGPDAVLGTVTIYVPAGVVELRIVVSGYKDQIKRAEGSTTTRITAGRQVQARAVLQPFSDSGDGSVNDSRDSDTADQADTSPADGTDGPADTGTTPDGPPDAGATPDGPPDNGAAPDAGSPESGSPDCQGSSLAGRAEAPVAAVDLTAEGTLDWRFWGPPGTVDFKRTAGNRISDYTPIGTVSPATRFRNTVSFAWSDGSPTVTTTGASDTLDVTTMMGAGAALTVPATAAARTLSVYVGGDNDTGSFEASLSDGCVADYAATATNGRSGYNVVYRVTFQSATPGAVLRVRWTMLAGFGGIGLYAATLN